MVFGGGDGVAAFFVGGEGDGESGWSDGVGDRLVRNGGDGEGDGVAAFLVGEGDDEGGRGDGEGAGSNLISVVGSESPKTSDMFSLVG